MPYEGSNASKMRVGDVEGTICQALRNAPLVVHDCGLQVAALGDYPGPYTKYVNYKLGTRGLLALLAGEGDRRAGWDEAVVYVDAAGRASGLRLFVHRCRLASSGVSSPYCLLMVHLYTTAAAAATAALRAAAGGDLPRDLVVRPWAAAPCTPSCPPRNTRGWWRRTRRGSICECRGPSGRWGACLCRATLGAWSAWRT